MHIASARNNEFASSRITASSSRPVRGSRAKSPAPLRASGSSRINSEISANSDDVRPEVSRAEGKLAGAARAFAYDFRGKVVLDIGSSTGGFTEYALRHGAKKVIAIEKGTGQMKVPLRFDPRVELHEKTDIMDVFFDTFPDVILADVSFTSLKPILEHARRNLADGGTDLLVMLKPQFEARPEQLWKGVVKNERMRRDIIKNFEAWLKKNGFVIINKRDNEVVGKNGNQERFYWLKIAK